MKDETYLIGIQHEREVYGIYTSMKEIKNIMEFGLELTPFYLPFKKTLSELFPNFNENLIKLEDVFKWINSLKFMKSVPLFLNSRETHCNIELLKAAIILSKKQLLTNSEIKSAVSSYTMACTGTRSKQKIPLNFEYIEYTLRILNKAISETVYKMWLERNKQLLECTRDKSRYILEHEFLPSPDTFDQYILVHEFLFLVPNACDRISKIAEIYEAGLKKWKDTTSHLQFEKVDLTAALKNTNSWLQFKNILRNELDNKLKGRAIRQDPIHEDDIDSNRKRKITISLDQKYGDGKIAEQIFENSRIKSMPTKVSDINMNVKDLRQIMYDANTFLKVANDELTHMSHNYGTNKRRNNLKQGKLLFKL